MLTDVYYVLDKGPKALCFLESFMASWGRHPEGSVSFALHVLVRPQTPSGVRAEALSIVSSKKGALLDVPDIGLAIGAYYRAAQLTKGDVIVCLNSYTRALRAGWLAALSDASARPDIAIVGATASHETPSTYARTIIPFPAFPNPHVRLTAFALKRSTLLGLRGLLDLRTQEDTIHAECGHQSITRQACAGGLRAIVVNSDGNLFDLENAQQAETFREGRQEKLLVADKRTDHYQIESPVGAVVLRILAWGSLSESDRKTLQPLIDSGAIQLVEQITHAR